MQQQIVCDEVETVKGFCYLGNRLNASGGCEATVTAKIRLGWKKISRVCQYSLQMKGNICKGKSKSFATKFRKIYLKHLI